MASICHLALAARCANIHVGRCNTRLICHLDVVATRVQMSCSWSLKFTSDYGANNQR